VGIAQVVEHLPATFSMPNFPPYERRDAKTQSQYPVASFKQKMGTIFPEVGPVYVRRHSSE
jgi:hypothetical protein